MVRKGQFTLAGFAAAMLLIFAGFVRAQSERSRDVFSVSVNFGWQNRMIADRWSPITCLISAGESTVSGTVTAEYDQDVVSSAKISVPFAVASGLTTPVQIIAAVPSSLGWLKLTVRDENGRELWAQSFGRSSISQPLPEIVGPEVPLVGVIGWSSISESMRDWPRIVAAAAFEGGNIPDRAPLNAQRAAAGYLERAWTYAAVVRADVGLLPTSWMAYDALAALVVVPDSSKPPDPRAVEAIHQWVASGGRLFVVTDAAGDAWRAWAPPSLDSTMSLGPVQRLPVPDKAAAAIARVADRARILKQAEATGIVTPGVDGPLPVAAQTQNARPIRVEPGPTWTVHWPFAGEPSGGLVVEGRLGFGSFVLVGFDPAKSTESASTLGSGAVWRSVLETAMTDVLERAMSLYNDNSSWSGLSMTSQGAVNSGLERLARIPGIGTSIIALFMACLLLLTALVGPVDFFLLRWRRCLQRSWLTALGWIAIASMFAYLGPRFLRTEPTHINRISVEDCIATNAAARGPGMPTSFRSGLTGVYAGDAGVMKFASPDPASWWRGVSVAYSDQAPIGGGRAIIPLAQRAAGGASGSQRGCPLEEFPAALWTFRTFADESAPATEFRAGVRKVKDAYSVFISGLPAGVKVTDAALRTGAKWYALRPQPRWKPNDPNQPPVAGGFDLHEPLGTIDDDMWSASFALSMGDKAPPLSWAPTTNTFNRYTGYDSGSVDTRPGALMSLHTVARRTRGFDRLTEGDSWAAIFIEVSDWPVDTPVTWVAKGEQTRILRVLVPVQDQ